MNTNYTGLCIGLREGKEVFFRTAADVIERLGVELDKHRWIPVDERLPEEVGEYEVANEEKWWKEQWCFVDHSGALGWERTGMRVTHWRPVTLP